MSLLVLLRFRLALVSLMTFEGGEAGIGRGAAELVPFWQRQPHDLLYTYISLFTSLLFAGSFHERLIRSSTSMYYIYSRWYLVCQT